MSLSEIGSRHPSVTKAGPKQSETATSTDGKLKSGKDSFSLALSRGGGKKELGGLLSLFGTSFSAARAMVPDFSSKKNDRIDDTYLRDSKPREDKESRFDNSDRERDGKKIERSSDDHPKSYNDRDKKLRSDDQERDSHSPNRDKSSERHSDIARDDQNIKDREKSESSLDKNDKDTVVFREDVGRNDNKNSQSDSEKNIEAVEGQKLKDSDKSIDTNNYKQAKLDSVSRAASDTLELNKNTAALLVGIIATLINLLNEQDASGGEDAKNIANLINDRLSDSERDALFSAIGLIIGGSENPKGTATKQIFASSSNLDDLAKNLQNLLSTDEMKNLKSALVRITSGDAQDSDAKNHIGKSPLDLKSGTINIEAFDSQRMERLQQALNRILSDYKGGGKIQDGVKNNLGVKLEVQSDSGGAQGVMRINPINNSDVLAKLQSQAAENQDQVMREMPRDLLLRTQKTFSETDAGKIERAIVKSTDNALAQINGGGLNATALRTQSEKALQRFSSESSLKNGGGESKSVKVTISDSKAMLDDLIKLGNSERNNFSQRGSENSQGKLDGNSILTSLNSGKSDKISDVMKNQVEQKRNNMYDVREQVRVNVQRAVNSGQDRIRLQLTPQELGRLDVRISMTKDGTIVAKVFVERKETLDLLRNDARSLMSALQDSGLKTDSDSLEFSLQGGSQEQAQKNKKKGLEYKDTEVEAIGGETENSEVAKADARDPSSEIGEENDDDKINQELDILV